MLLGTLEASLLGNLLIGGKAIINSTCRRRERSEQRQSRRK